MWAKYLNTLHLASHNSSVIQRILPACCFSAGSPGPTDVWSIQTRWIHPWRWGQELKMKLHIRVVTAATFDWRWTRRGSEEKGRGHWRAQSCLCVARTPWMTYCEERDKKKNTFGWRMYRNDLLKQKRVDEGFLSLVWLERLIYWLCIKSFYFPGTSFTAGLLFFSVVNIPTEPAGRSLDWPTHPFK